MPEHVRSRSDDLYHPLALFTYQGEAGGAHPFWCAVHEMFCEFYVLDQLDMGIEVERRCEDTIEIARFGELLLCT